MLLCSPMHAMHARVEQVSSLHSTWNAAAEDSGAGDKRPDALTLAVLIACSV